MKHRLDEKINELIDKEKNWNKSRSVYESEKEKCKIDISTKNKEIADFKSIANKAKLSKLNIYNIWIAP